MTLMRASRNGTISPRKKAHSSDVRSSAVVAAGVPCFSTNVSSKCYRTAFAAGSAGAAKYTRGPCHDGLLARMVAESVG